MHIQNAKTIHMKFLKIENNKAFYRINPSIEDWTEIDQINKDHLLILLTSASDVEFDMDDYNEELLQNPAHNIIYKNIWGKFTEFLKNKTRFKDSVEAMYKQAIEKYQLNQE